jgi:uncharacterized protein
MSADLDEKTVRYCELLNEALAAAEIAVPADTPMGEAAAECREMAVAYLADAEHFADSGDPVNALAAASYGHGWLDCGARLGLFEIPDGHLFAV